MKAVIDTMKDEVIKYYLDGHTVKEVCSYFSVSDSVVYRFFKRHGIAVGGLDLMTRVKRRVEVRSDGCWIWKGHKERKGYGKLTVNDGVNEKSYLAHRLSYELHKGPIPTGLHLDHLCCNVDCVNPDHLEPVTSEENMRRAVARRKDALNIPWKKLYMDLYRETYNVNASESECIEYARSKLRKRSS